MVTKKLNEIHRPTKKGARIFLVVAIVIAIGMLAWTFYFNRGPLLISGHAPFSYEVKGKEYTCEKSPCGRKLEPGSYTLIAKKAGYYDNRQEAKISRGKLTSLTMRFKFIPTVEMRGALTLPIKNAPLNSEFIGLEKIAGLGSSAENVEFSANGKQVFYKTNKIFSLLQIETKKIRPTPFGDEDILKWGGNNLYVLKKIEDGAGQEIVRWDGKEEVKIVRLNRALTSPEVHASPSGNFMLVRDTEYEPEALYVIDLQLKTRKRLPISAGEVIKDIKLTKNYIVLKNEKGVRAYNYKTSGKIELAAVDSKTVSEPSNNSLLLVTKNDQALAQRGVIGISIGEAIEKASEDVSENLLNKGKLYIARFDIESETYETLTSMDAPNEGEITQLEEEDGVINFVLNGILGIVRLGEG